MIVRKNSENKMPNIRNAILLVIDSASEKLFKQANASMPNTALVIRPPITFQFMLGNFMMRFLSLSYFVKVVLIRFSNSLSIGFSSLCFCDGNK